MREEQGDETMDVRKRILIVDDETRVLFVLRGALTRLGDGYQVVTASSGRAALATVKQTPFDLVLTDLRMPDMDGIALTEAIRALQPGTVVIWMTAYGHHKVRTEAAQLAVYRCLDKPIKIGQIRQIVLEALGSAEKKAAKEG
jgi:DNA-binding NtrC family response regulator